MSSYAAPGRWRLDPSKPKGPKVSTPSSNAFHVSSRWESSLNHSRNPSPPPDGAHLPPLNPTSSLPPPPGLSASSSPHTSSHSTLSLSSQSLPARQPRSQPSHPSHPSPSHTSHTSNSRGRSDLGVPPASSVPFPSARSPSSRPPPTFPDSQPPRSITAASDHSLLSQPQSHRELPSYSTVPNSNSHATPIPPQSSASPALPSFPSPGTSHRLQRSPPSSFHDLPSYSARPSASHNSPPPPNSTARPLTAPSLQSQSLFQHRHSRSRTARKKFPSTAQPSRTLARLFSSSSRRLTSASASSLPSLPEDLQLYQPASSTASLNSTATSLFPSRSLSSSPSPPQSLSSSTSAMPSVLSSRAPPKVAPPGPPLEAAPAFVYPSSRSKAKPSTSPTSTTTRFTLKGKKKQLTRKPSDLSLHTPGTSLPTGTGSVFTVQPPKFSASTTELSSPPTASGSGQRYSRSSVESTDSSSSNLSSQPSSPQRLNRVNSARSLRSPVALTRKTSLPGLSPSSPPSAFVFPTSRSRAHPSASPSFTPTGFKFKGRKKYQYSKSSNALIHGLPHSERERSHNRFLGIRLPRAKKGKKSPRSSLPPKSADAGLLDGDTPKKSGETQQSESEVGHGRDVERMNSSMGYNRPTKHDVKFNRYPLDPYDPTLMESDRLTGELLRRLNPTGSPSFHNYGSNPPSAVLDLGCGQGHWVLEAAVAWKEYGTKVVGYDMVDVAKRILPWAINKGVVENTRFVRGNFLKNPLPFADKTFDLVRMSNLTLCISYEKWEFVLIEVSRVLRTGGRLELVDDEIFFPYGKASIPRSQSVSSTPILDVPIPNARFSTFQSAEVSDADDDDDGDDIYDLYGLDERDEGDDADDGCSDAATVGEYNPKSSNYTPPSKSDTPAPPPTPPSTPYNPWDDEVASARDLESLFEEVLNKIYGIHMCPFEFVVDLMTHVFGNARQVNSLHLTLAPSDTHPDGGETWGDNIPRARGVRNGTYPRSPDAFGTRVQGHFVHPYLPSAVISHSSNALSQSPGLVLWPSTFIPMPPAELELHAIKHVRVLVACKAAMADYIAAENEDDDGSRDDEFWEAMRKYEWFLGQRFNPPDAFGSQMPTFEPDDQPKLRREASSGHTSVRSFSSLSAEAKDAMREYQSELHQRFDWPAERPQSQLTLDELELEDLPTPTTSRFPNGHSDNNQRVSYPHRSPDPRHSAATSVCPPYSRNELTHVRTIHVYEAIKMGDGILAAAF